jgi:hypothetical protein
VRINIRIIIFIVLYRDHLGLLQDIREDPRHKHRVKFSAQAGNEPFKNARAVWNK